MIPGAIKAVVINEYRSLALMAQIKPTASNLSLLWQVYRELKAIRLGAATIIN